MLRFLTVGLGHLFRSRQKRAPEAASGAPDREMGFFEHLEELRSTLLSCLGAFTVAVVLAFVFSREIFDLMRHPLREAIKGTPVPAPPGDAAADPVEFVRSLASLLLNGEIPAPGAAQAPQFGAAEAAIAAAHTTASGQGMVVMKFMDVFSILLNIGLVGGLALSSGFILYFASRFVGPALTPSEKKCVVPFCLSAMLLFFGGCAFSFLWLIPVSIQVMFHFVRMFNLTMPWLASDYYGFVTMMTLLVGLAFQFPLVVVILQYLEIVRTSTLFRLWRHVLVGILVASLVISPLGDPVSLSVLTGVLFLLYIVAASVGGMLVGRKIKRREAEEAEYERQYGKPHPDRLARESSGKTPETPAEDYGSSHLDSDADDEDGASRYDPYESTWNGDEDSENGRTDDESANSDESTDPYDSTDSDSDDSSDSSESTDSGDTGLGDDSGEQARDASLPGPGAGEAEGVETEAAAPGTPPPAADETVKDAPAGIGAPAAAQIPPPAKAGPSSAPPPPPSISRIGRQSELDLIE
jgi:sec-independent protein translocase protein TatC